MASLVDEKVVGLREASLAVTAVVALSQGPNLKLNIPFNIHGFWCLIGDIFDPRSAIGGIV